MRYLLDSGVLLRLLNQADVIHPVVREAVLLLRARGHVCVTGLQNLCEFWNVCTRPATARGGLGWNFDQTYRRLRIIERFIEVLPDRPEVLVQWRALVVQHRVQGVQAHDTRLAALMQVHGVTNLVTLNPKDFARFSLISPMTPAEVIKNLV